MNWKFFEWGIFFSLGILRVDSTRVLNSTKYKKVQIYFNKIEDFSRILFLKVKKLTVVFKKDICPGI